ncbi:required for excision 1-B domain-containing protein-like [Glandiceps talaboti]
MCETDESVKELIRKFYSLQEERVHTYIVFDGHHHEYLSGAPNYDFPKYRQAVHEMTQEFSKISKDIIAIEEKLKNSHSRNDLAAIVRIVQDEEKNKLELTAQMQLAKQNMVDHPRQDTYKEELSQLKKRLMKTKENIIEALEDLKYESEDLEAR